MQKTEPEPDFDWTSGYPSSHLSFIYNGILPQRYICGDVVKDAIQSAYQDNREILVEDENINVELLDGPFEGYLIPTHKHRFEGTIHELSSYQIYVTYNKKRVGYAIENEIKHQNKDDTGRKNDKDKEESNSKDNANQINSEDHTDRKSEDIVLVYDREINKGTNTKETANVSNSKENKQLKQKEEADVPCDFIVDTINTRPGYFKVKIANPDSATELSSEVNEKNWLSINAMRKNVYGVLKETIKDPGNRKTRLTQKVVMTNGETSSDEKEEDIAPTIPDFDMQKTVVALPFAHWPKEATKWLNRPRRSGWPDSDTIQEVSKEVVMVIPSESSCNDNEWCFSFIKAETKLFNKLNNIQRQCFVLLNILRKQSLMFPNILTVDHLKTVFLWTCEKIPQEEWSYENFGTFFVYLIDYMLECFINEEIPHYFMPECNLLINLAEDFQDDMMTALANLRTTPVEPFYTYLASHQFPHLPKKPLQIVFEIIEEEKAFDDHTKIFQKQYQCLSNLTMELVTEGKLEVALDLQSDVNELLKSINQTDREGGLLSTIALQVDTDKSIEVYEFLLQKFPDTAQKYHFLGNLACMYHSKYATVMDEPSRTEFKEKTESTFQEALSSTGASSATKTDYCNFLFSTGQYDEVLALTTDVIQAESLKVETGRVDGNSYGKGEQNTVDSNVQSMIDGSGGEVSLMSYIYASYLKVQSFMNIGKLEDAKTMLSDLSSACTIVKMSGKKHQHYLETSFTLLGFACKDLDEYDQARKAFRSVEKMNKSNVLATNNKDECTAMLLSLNPEFTVESECEEESDTGVSDQPIPAHLLEALAKIATKMTPDDQETDMSDGQHAVNLHRQYAIAKEERDKAELKEKTQVQFKKALSDEHVTLTTKMAYANFLYHTEKYEQAMGVLDEILDDQSKKNGSDLQVICYTMQDLAIVDSNVQDELTGSEGEAQYLVYIYAFYTMIKCFQHLRKTIQATQYLPKLKIECDRISASVDKKHAVTSFSLLGHAARDLEDFDFAIASFNKVLELQPDSMNAKQNKDLCEGTKLSKEIFESESGNVGMEELAEGSTGSQGPNLIPGMLQDAVKKIFQKPQETKEEKENFDDLDLD